MSKLLIVDDSAALLEVMKNILERNGYIVKTLNKTAGIFNEIREFQPDLLILDIYLAGEDGREIGESTKKRMTKPNMYVYWYFLLLLKHWKIIKAIMLMTLLKNLLT